MRTIFGSSLLSVAIAALLWIIISFATGGGVLFSLGGGIALGVVVFIIGHGFRRRAIDRRRAASGSPRLPVAQPRRPAGPGLLRYRDHGTGEGSDALRREGDGIARPQRSRVRCPLRPHSTGSHRHG